MGNEDRLRKIKIILKTLPDKPGVYKHIDSEGQILYVGKAKNLKKRVSSYFSKKHSEERLRMLVRRVENVEIIITNTEFDALLLENTLIKKFQPWYNINLKDGKTYPWICIKKERFPRVFSTRNRIEDGSEYFGPYPSSRMLRTLLELIGQLYSFRTCSLSLSESSIHGGKHKVCLEYHMGNCKGPCEDKQSEKSYNQDIKSVRRLLKGELKAIRKNLHEDMMLHSQKSQFELAHQFKERLEHLKKYQSKSAVLNPAFGEIDLYSVVDDAEYGYVNFMMIREGSLVHSFTLELKKKMQEKPEELLQLAIPEIRILFKSEAKLILLSHSVEYELPGIKFQVPIRGDKVSAIQMSLRNAKAYRIERLKNIQIVDPDRHTNRIMAQMKHDLRMPCEPRHIECFDNSNIQGEFPVSACVVFRDGKPSRNEYRHFNIKTVIGADDYASMEEVVYRRYRRILEESGPLPNLVVIDGGKGQLSSAIKALNDLELSSKISIVGIAKRLEEIYFPNDSIPLYIDKRSESLKILQQARNEAHRFGITFHRKKRSKSSIKSKLDAVKGIGPSTQKVLLSSFKSIARLKKSDLNSIESLIGVAKAKLIWSWIKQEA
jgi:excinuclease ABC subunit C|tara:strand:+ start:1283 stop:3094 length:1812 start_codon:yes stop_codon:yes gene_type:complete